MSVKDYLTTIIIKDINGEVEVIHDFYKYNNELQQLMLYERLHDRIKNNNDFYITYGKDIYGK